MSKQYLKILIICLTLSSCAMNIHSADRAVMLDHGETELMGYAGLSLGGGINFEYNAGLGLGGKIGLTDRATIGATADFNYNSTKPQWVNSIFYGQVSVEQKFALVKDIFALKLKEGIFYNNYFGTVQKNPSTGLYAFTSREEIIPYFSPAFYISPEGRRDKKWQITLGLNSTIGIRDGFTPWTIGSSVLFDYSENKAKYITGFELGGGLQTLSKDAEVVYFSIGLFFSSFKNGKSIPTQ